MLDAPDETTIRSSWSDISSVHSPAIKSLSALSAAISEHPTHYPPSTLAEMVTASIDKVKELADSHDVLGAMAVVLHELLVPRNPMIWMDVWGECIKAIVEDPPEAFPPWALRQIASSHQHSHRLLPLLDGYEPNDYPEGTLRRIALSTPRVRIAARFINLLVAWDPRELVGSMEGTRWFMMLDGRYRVLGEGKVWLYNYQRRRFEKPTIPYESITSIEYENGGAIEWDGEKEDLNLVDAAELKEVVDELVFLKPHPIPSRPILCEDLFPPFHPTAAFLLNNPLARAPSLIISKFMTLRRAKRELQKVLGDCVEYKAIVEMMDIFEASDEYAVLVARAKKFGSYEPVSGLGKVMRA